MFNLLFIMMVIMNANFFLTVNAMSIKTTCGDISIGHNTSGTRLLIPLEVNTIIVTK